MLAIRSLAAEPNKAVVLFFRLIYTFAPVQR